MTGGCTGLCNKWHAPCHGYVKLNIKASFLWIPWRLGCV